MVQTVNKRQIMVAIVLVATSYSVGRFTGPTKVEVKEVEKVVYQERVKKDSERTVERNIRETTLPDGTVIKEVLQTRNTKTKTDSDTSAVRESSSSQTTTNRPDWRIGLGYNPTIPSFQEQSYSFRLERQLIGELYAGVQLDSRRQVGFSLSIGF